MISAAGLGKRFGDGWVFRGVTFQLPERGLVVVLGPNGSGKTTLLKILATLLEPTEGEVKILGLSWGEARRRLRREVLYAHQEPVVLSGTVEDNLFCRDYDVEDALGLRPVLRKKAKSLSGGYRKLVTLARVLACRPKVALLDEPTAFLDPEKRQIAAAHIAEYSRKNLVMWTSHYPSELPPAERLYELRDGALKELSNIR